MGALLIFIIRTKFYTVLGKLRKQNTKRNDNRIQMGCELEKPNPASFGSTAVKTDSGTNAIHLVVSMMPIVATECWNQGEELILEQSKSKHKQVFVGIFLSTFPCTLLRWLLENIDCYFSLPSKLLAPLFANSELYWGLTLSETPKISAASSLTYSRFFFHCQYFSRSREATRWRNPAFIAEVLSSFSLVVIIARSCYYQTMKHQKMPQWILWVLHELFPDLTLPRIYSTGRFASVSWQLLLLFFFLTLLMILCEFHSMCPNPISLPVPPYLLSTIAASPTLPQWGVGPTLPDSHPQGHTHATRASSTCCPGRVGGRGDTLPSAATRNGQVLFSLYIHWQHSETETVFSYLDCVL